MTASTQNMAQLSAADAQQLLSRLEVLPASANSK